MGIGWGERPRIAISGKGLMSFFVITAIFKNNALLFRPLFYIALSYFVLYTAGRTFVKKIRLRGDYSYGIYIYGWTIQQCLTTSFPNRGPFFNIALALPISYLMGMLSWNLIEKSALVNGKLIAITIWDNIKKASFRSWVSLPIQYPSLTVYTALILIPSFLIFSQANQHIQSPEFIRKRQVISRLPTTNN